MGCFEISNLWEKLNRDDLPVWPAMLALLFLVFALNATPRPFYYERLELRQAQAATRAAMPTSTPTATSGPNCAPVALAEVTLAGGRRAPILL